MTTEWKLVPVELTEEMIKVYKQFHSEGRMLQNLTLWKSMLAAAPQPPALGGEPEIIYQLKNNALKTDWRSADKVAFDSAANLPEYSRRELIDRAHVAPLLTEIERLKARNAEAVALLDRMQTYSAKYTTSPITEYKGEIAAYLAQTAPAAKDGAQ